MRRRSALKKTVLMQCRTPQLIHCAMHWQNSGRLFHWLLEASVVLELAMHKYYEAAVIAACSYWTKQRRRVRKEELHPGTRPASPPFSAQAPTCP